MPSISIVLSISCFQKHHADFAILAVAYERFHALTSAAEGYASTFFPVFMMASFSTRYRPFFTASSNSMDPFELFREEVYCPHQNSPEVISFTETVLSVPGMLFCVDSFRKLGWLGELFDVRVSSQK